MKLGDRIKLQQSVSQKVAELCTQPIASSQEEVNAWQNSPKLYLLSKAQRVASLPDAWLEEVDQMFTNSQDFYVGMVTSWYATGFENVSKALLRQQKQSGLISHEQMRQEFDAIKAMDVETVATEDKIRFFFDLFDALIEQMKNQENWYKLYQQSYLGPLSERLVWNISALDLFSWQLPAADSRKIHRYKQIARIMVIFFFFEKIYKNASQLASGNETNPIDKIQELSKILAYHELLTTL